MNTTTTRRERPIIFNERMVRALLDGDKTQTRRIVVPTQPIPADLVAFEMRHDPIYRQWVLGPANAGLVAFMQMGHGWVSNAFGKPAGLPGERLWVREAAYIAPPGFGDRDLQTFTDSEGCGRMVGHVASMDGDSCAIAEGYGVKRTPSIHMPRWAARIFLDLTGVKVERLQHISGADARQEMERAPCEEHDFASGGCSGRCPTQEAAQVKAFAKLWDGIHQAGSRWEDNPWVWVYSFQRVPSASKEGASS